jgi:hypothetical protein
MHDAFNAVNVLLRHDKVILTHFIEHLEVPVGVLTRINKEWLAADCLLYIACRNVSVPSLHPSGKMGLVSHSAAVTPTAEERDHRSNYSLDPPRQEAVVDGVRIDHLLGIFVRAVVNFHWDRMLITDTISKEHPVGCYPLDQCYFYLCTNILMMCKGGPLCGLVKG